MTDSNEETNKDNIEEIKDTTEELKETSEKTKDVTEENKNTSEKTKDTTEELKDVTEENKNTSEELKETTDDDLQIEPVNLSRDPDPNDIKNEECNQACSNNEGLGPKNVRSFFIGFLVVIIIIFFAIYTLNTGDSIPKTTKHIVSTGNLPPEENDTEANIMYNGHDFLRYNRMWRTGILKGKSLYDLEFYFNPLELENITMDGGFNDELNQNKLYVTFDPRDKNLSYIALSIGQFDTHMIKSFGKEIVPACAFDDEACKERPLINCENTKSTPVYYFKEADTPSVTIKDNCVMIQGEGWGLVKATERFLMTSYAILK